MSFWKKKDSEQKLSSPITLSEHSEYIPSFLSSTQLKIYTPVVKETKIQAKLYYDMPACIEGEVEGEIRSASKLIIAEGATVTGSVYAKELIISGEVQGEILVKGNVELKATAIIKGNLFASNLIIKNGAKIFGTINCNEGLLARKIKEQEQTGAVSLAA